MTNTILHIDSSARAEASLSRQVTQYLVEQLSVSNGDGVQGEILYRDLSTSHLPFLTEERIDSYFTDPDQRSQEQRELLVTSDVLVNELKQAKQLVIGAPMYNFSVAASLKAWIDLVCRVGETFVYTENGPKGLTNIDTAYIVYASGGTPIKGEFDFLSQYLEKICQFLGVKQVHIIDASGSKREADTIFSAAKGRVDDLLQSIAV